MNAKHLYPTNDPFACEIGEKLNGDRRFTNEVFEDLIKSLHALADEFSDLRSRVYKERTLDAAAVKFSKQQNNTLAKKLAEARTELKSLREENSGLKLHSSTMRNSFYQANEEVDLLRYDKRALKREMAWIYGIGAPLIIAAATFFILWMTS